MALQTQLMQRMVEAMEHRGNGGNRNAPPEEDLTKNIERFIRLKAPTFSYSDEPLDAADWLRVIETKLDFIVYTDKECVAVTTHQLEGPAKSWWENYSTSHPNPSFITWLEFCGAFREQDLPSELMVQKAQEFRTDQKKQFWFLRGLHHGLHQGLKASEHKSLRHLVNRAIALEDERRGHGDCMKDKKSMGDRDHFDRSFQRPRDGPSSMMRGSFRLGFNQHGSNFRGGSSHYSGGGSFNYQQQDGGYNRPQPSTPRPSTREFTPTCFTCGKPGHKSFQCPDKKIAATSAKAPTPGGGHPQSAPQQSASRGRLMSHPTQIGWPMSGP
jgi:hypothetical protein